MRTSDRRRSGAPILPPNTQAGQTTATSRANSDFSANPYSRNQVPVSSANAPQTGRLQSARRHIRHGQCQAGMDARTCGLAKSTTHPPMPHTWPFDYHIRNTSVSGRFSTLPNRPPSKRKPSAEWTEPVIGVGAFVVDTECRIRHHGKDRYAAREARPSHNQSQA